MRRNVPAHAAPSQYYSSDPHHGCPLRGYAVWCWPFFDPGTEALLYIEKRAPRAMLLDLMLPGMNGEELLAKVKKEYPSNPPAPYKYLCIAAFSCPAFRLLLPQIRCGAGWKSMAAGGRDGDGGAGREGAFADPKGVTVWAIIF